MCQSLNFTLARNSAAFKLPMVETQRLYDVTSNCDCGNSNPIKNLPQQQAHQIAVSHKIFISNTRTSSVGTTGAHTSSGHTHICLREGKLNFAPPTYIIVSPARSRRPVVAISDIQEFYLVESLFNFNHILHTTK